MKWSRKYIGLPYKDFGTDFDGVYCWGLAQLVYKNELNINLPSYDEISKNLVDMREVPVNTYFEGFYPVEEERGFDLLHCYNYTKLNNRWIKAPMHVGIIIKKGWILHIEEGKFSCIENYTYNVFARRAIGAYRYAL